MAIIIAIIVVCVIVVALAMHNHRTFLSKNQTCNFILEDRDGYISNFDPANMFSRGFSHTTDPRVYKRLAAATAADFTPSERAQLRKTAAQANASILAQNSQAEAVLGPVSAKLLADIPWKFAKIKGSLYEAGMPHTREDIIFLNNANISPELLIHEKMHLFTRAYKKETHDVLSQYGFSELPVNESAGSPSLHRANPDISDTADRQYFHPLKGKISSRFYNTRPAHINHINTSLRNEHPYEWLAYLVGSNLERSYK